MVVAGTPSAASGSGGPDRITVLIATFKRPEGLARLLQALAGQRRTTERPFVLDAVVVDNDAEGSAKAVVAEVTATTGLSARYILQPDPGIPQARNAGLRALPPDADYAAFIDDDEWPEPDWIDAMLCVATLPGTNAVLGPVVPQYEAGVPTVFIVSKVFERRRHRTGTVVGYGATNNALVSAAFLRRYGLRFEERMRFTGGSDYELFRGAIRLGMTIRWADDAVVYEAIGPDRANLRWVLRRQYRMGNTLALVDRFEGRPGQAVFRLVYGLARISLGIVMVPAWLISTYRGMRGIVHVMRGAGAIAGVLGSRSEPYRPPRPDAIKDGGRGSP